MKLYPFKYIGMIMEVVIMIRFDHLLYNDILYDYKLLLS